MTTATGGKKITKPREQKYLIAYGSVVGGGGGERGHLSPFHNIHGGHIVKNKYPQPPYRESLSGSRNGIDREYREYTLGEEVTGYL